MRLLLVVLVLGACGRIAFDERVASDGAADAGAGEDALPLDGQPACTSTHTLYPTASYAVAIETCEQQGGVLVTVDDAEESMLVASLGGGTGVWIGINDRDEEGTFVWVDGSGQAFRDWRTGQPNDGAGGSSEDCGAAFADGWRDQDCFEDELPFVCQCN